VLQFSAPLVVVRRKADNARGTLEFTADHPRVYFDFKAEPFCWRRYRYIRRVAVRGE
jgi:uncharacterized Zn-finger protein